MTSAPRSARIIVAYGPAMKCEKSTTRTSRSGVSAAWGRGVKGGSVGFIGGSLVDPAHHFLQRRTCRAETVGGMVGVGIAEGNAADDVPVLGDAEPAAQHRGALSQRGLCHGGDAV